MRNEPTEVVEYKGFTIEVYLEDSYHDDMSPRSWDNFGRMLLHWGNYTLGDESEREEFPDIYCFQEWLDEGGGKEIAVLIPLRMYEHGGLGLSTSSNSYPYNCPWDSGWAGAIYVTKEDVRKVFGVKRISKRLLEKVERVLRQEVETYHQYISGDVWYYNIDSPNGEPVGGCCGFYGSDFEENGLLEQARDDIDCYIEQEKEERAERKKAEVARLSRQLRLRYALLGGE